MDALPSERFMCVIIIIAVVIIFGAGMERIWVNKTTGVQVVETGKFKSTQWTNTSEVRIEKLAA